MYKVICTFTDLQDNRHVYLCGDVYPREGVQPSNKRISELLGADNRLNKPLIVDTDAESKTDKTPQRRKRGKRNENN